MDGLRQQQEAIVAQGQVPLSAAAIGKAYEYVPLRQSDYLEQRYKQWDPGNLAPWKVLDYPQWGSTAETIMRNQHGAVLYNDNCRDCKEHEETGSECNLCNTYICYGRVHVKENGKKVNDTLDHFCEEARKYLLIRLEAVIYV